jgi:ABC-type transport system involved in multi-copper enzyme maturation permease subunit
MNALLTVIHLTLHEASRRRILVATLIGAMGFLLLYGTGFYFIASRIAEEAGPSVLKQRLLLNFFTLAGLYATHFLTLMTAVLLPVDTLSGEIASGVVQTLASKPVRRSTIVLGKWIAFSLVVVGYLAVVAGGVLLIARVLGGFTPPGLAIGLPLMALEGIVLVSVSIAGGAHMSTVTNGVTAFGLYGIAFIGGWAEQIGTFASNRPTQNVGTVASLIMPSEALWQRAAYHMQPSVMRELVMTPFSPASVPSPAMVWWAVGYVIVALLIAIRGFGRRAL